MSGGRYVFLPKITSFLPTSSGRSPLPRCGIEKLLWGTTDRLAALVLETMVAPRITYSTRLLGFRTLRETAHSGILLHISIATSYFKGYFGFPRTPTGPIRL